MSFFEKTTKSGFSRVILMLGLLALAGAAQATQFLYTGGHGLDDSRLASIGGNSYVEMGSSDADWATAFAGGYGSFDAIVVGEASGSETLSSTTINAIRNYVTHGGKIIIVNDHNGQTYFTNAVFGYGVVANYGCEDSEDFGSSIQPAVAGTTFAGGPEGLTNLSCTAALNTASVPAGAKIMYSDPTNGTQVFAKGYGLGTVIWLGWDYCCGSYSYETDWYTVMDSSLKYLGPVGAIQAIIDSINASGTSSYYKSYLTSPLKLALYYLTKTNGTATIPNACLQMNYFISKVRSAVSAHAISAEYGDELIGQATYVRSALGCK